MSKPPSHANLRPRVSGTPSSEIARFWSKVDKRGADECWPWLGGTTKHGYGYFYSAGKAIRAHRLAYEIATGDAPGADDVHHECEKKLCVNPAHLFRVPRGSHRALHKRGQRNPNVRLTAEQVAYIRANRGVIPQKELAAEFGVIQQTISMVMTGNSWEWMDAE